MELLIIVLLAFFLRFIFIFSGTNTDDYVHLWNIRLRQKNHRFKINTVTNSLIDGKRGYPTLAHYLISFFPEKYWIAVGKLFNILYDCLLIITSYYLSLFLFKRHLYLIPRYEIINPHTAVALLLATSPILMPVTARLQSFGARTIGVFLSFLYFFFLGYSLLFNPYIGGGLCVVLGILIVITSQFALQNMLFISIILMLIYFNIIPFLILSLIGLICWFVPLGAQDIFTFKIAHLRWYIKNQQKGTGPTGRNKLSDILFIPIYLFKNLKNFIHTVFNKSSYIIAIYSLPPLIMSLIILVYFGNINLILDDPIIKYILSLTLSSIIVFFLTSLKSLLFLGEAERYLEYSSPFFMYLYIYLIMKYNLSQKLIYSIIIIQIIATLINFIISNIVELKYKIINKPCKNFHSLITTLEKQNKLNILTIPTKLAFEVSNYLNGEHKYFYRFIYEKGKGRGFKYMEEDFIWFDLPKPDMEYFKKKYNIDTIILDKKVRYILNKIGLQYNFKNFKVILDNDEYLVMRLS